MHPTNCRARRLLWPIGTVLGGALAASMAVLPAGAATSNPTSTTATTIPPGSTAVTSGTELTPDPAAQPSPGTPLSAQQVGATIAPVISAGTDLSQLTDSQLSLYHLPPRPPTGSPGYATWLQAMTDSVHALTPRFYLGRANPDVLQASLAQPDSSILGGDSGDYNPNWAGNIDTQYGNYTSVAGDWVEPNVYAGSGNRYSSRWLGLGALGLGTNLYQIGTGRHILLRRD